MLNKWIQNFLANTHWGKLDYLLLDLPPGTGDVAIDVAAMIPQAKEIIVTTPHNVASFVASRVGVMAKNTKHDILGIVETSNRCCYSFSILLANTASCVRPMLRRVSPRAGHR